GGGQRPGGGQGAGRVHHAEADLLVVAARGAVPRALDQRLRHQRGRQVGVLGADERGDPGDQRGGVAGPAAQEVLVAGPGDRQALARRGQQDRVVAVRERRAGVVGVRRGDRDDAGIGRRVGVGGEAVPVEGAFLLALVADR